MATACCVSPPPPQLAVAPAPLFLGTGARPIPSSANVPGCKFLSIEMHLARAHSLHAEGRLAHHVSLQRDMRASVVDIDAPVAMSQTRQWHGWAVAVDGARIAYVVHEPSAGQERDCVGVQRLPLMVCRGWGMVKEDSEALAALIANAWGRAVIAVDNRGSGESVMPVAAPHNEEKEGETCV